MKYVSTGQRIKELRKKKKMTMEQLGAKVGVNRSTISRYESDYVEKLQVQVLVPIADALGTTIAYLMGVTDDPSPRTVSEIVDWYNSLNDSTKDVGARLEEIMKERSVSIKDVSNAIGISPIQLQDMMLGKDREFDMALMKKFCEYFKVPYNYFVTKRYPVDDVVANIEALVKLDNITMDELAMAIEVVPNEVRHPKFSTLKAIADHYGYDLEDLLFTDFAKISQNEQETLRTILYISSSQWLNRVGSMLTNEQFDEVINYAKYLVERGKN